jgi:hypothetical protein
MTDKLTINYQTSYTLELNQEELDLIFALLSHVRLSADGNKYQQAAYDLLIAAEENGLLDFENVNVEFKKWEDEPDSNYLEVSEASE